MLYVTLYPISFKCWVNCEKNQLSFEIKKECESVVNFFARISAALCDTEEITEEIIFPVISLPVSIPVQPEKKIEKKITIDVAIKTLVKNLKRFFCLKPKMVYKMKLSNKL